MNTTVIPRNSAIHTAAQILISAVAERATRSPRQAAEAAFYPGHPLGSVNAIEAEITRRRAQAQVAAPALPQAA
ncbi:hypothetical protein ACFVHW_32480 [Streptomyces sp. NPDC127110]|uniref:hypothetical protein n=1 Tax=Streptomyces sp. NPDC127110 TaxID=3345362 RepID=UPI00363E89B3